MTRDELIAKIHAEVSVDGMLETIDHYVAERLAVRDAEWTYAVVPHWSCTLTPERVSGLVDKLEAQLAGCVTAALGYNDNPAKKGDYGWSPAYQDVLELRRRVDKQAERERALVGLALKMGRQQVQVSTDWSSSGMFRWASADDVLAEFVKRQDKL